MLTTNCNAHPVLRLMHKPDLDDEGKPLPDDQQDKYTVVALERDPSTREVREVPDSTDEESRAHAFYPSAGHDGVQPPKKHEP